ncbi:MAG: phosphodiester glycosidase family protein [Actinomycetota bacterium]
MSEHGRRISSMRPRARAIGVCAASAALLASLFAALPASGAPTGRPHVRVLAPGVAITTYIDRRFPIRTYVLTVDPSQGASIGVALSNDRLAGLEKTSDMAKRLGAIAAVNGDFGFTSGRPVHPFALDGDLVQTSNAFGVLFTLAADGTMQIAKPAKQEVAVTEVDSGETWPVAAWNNGRPSAGEITAFTAAGAGLDQPRPSTCSARLLPAGASSPTADGVTRTYSVDERGCFTSSLATQDGVVLSAAPTTDEATFLRSLTPGETIEISWSLGIPGVTDAIGGDRILVANGQVALGQCTGAVCGRNPRTAIGLTADGRVLIVVVDGRQSSSSGMSLLELAQFMANRLGAEVAMNLDGGGSSTMAVRGGVYNHPGDGFERSVSSAIVVRPGE